MVLIMCGWVLVWGVYNGGGSYVGLTWGARGGCHVGLIQALEKVSDVALREGVMWGLCRGLGKVCMRG